MRSTFYLRLAFSNLKKNKTAYFPYLLSCTSIVGLFYILDAIFKTVISSSIEGAGTMGYILMLSVIIVGMISVLIVFYTNSFLMKRRKKELGLYSVLGMEKRHIVQVIFWEITLTGVFSIAAGILGGILFTRLISLLLMNLLKGSADLGFFIPASSILTTILLFSVSFLAVLGYNFFTIHTANPLALIQSEKQGEREPKTKRLMTLLGILSLGTGYLLALTVQAPSDAIFIFFPAVFFVIAGTYLLFTSGSIALLKAARKNKRFYYKPENFISVSGMIYRMKQNAVGLANICILSTGVLVVLSSTVCLYIGEEDILKYRYPYQIQTSCIDSEQARQEMDAVTMGLLQENQIEMGQKLAYASSSFFSTLNGNQIEALHSDSADSVYLTVIPWSDYQANGGTEPQPAANQLLLYSPTHSFAERTLQIEQRTFQIAKQLESEEMSQVFPLASSAFVSVRNDIILIVPDLGTLDAVRDALQTNNPVPIYYHYNYDVSGEENAILNFCTALRPALKGSSLKIGTVETIFQSRQDFYSLYGSLMFVGLFFVALFLIATVLIIYYKQISEGYDDHDRFQIMQDVGLSNTEVKQTIQKQIMLVFFLPLAVSILHITVAFPVLCKLLTVFNMTNIGLFLLCTAGSILIFILFYLIVYQLTAKTYYRIVRSKTIVG